MYVLCKDRLTCKMLILILNFELDALWGKNAHVFIYAIVFSWNWKYEAILLMAAVSNSILAALKDAKAYQFQLERRSMQWARARARGKEAICSSFGCTNGVVKRGLCICVRHGEGRSMQDQAVKATDPPMEECASDMVNERSVQSRWCINQAIKRGLSIRLGAWKKPKQCSNDGCTNKVCNIITSSKIYRL